MEKLKVKKLYDVGMQEPEMLRFKEQPEHTKHDLVQLSYEAQRFISGKLGISPSILKKVYTKSDEAWKILYNACLFDENDEAVINFNSDELNYIVSSHEDEGTKEEIMDSIVSICENKEAQKRLDTFYESLEDPNYYVIEHYSQVLNIVKLIIMDKNDQSSEIPAVVVELNYEKGYYASYNAIFKDKQLLIISESVRKWSLVEFLESFFLENELSMSKKLMPLFLSDYDTQIVTSDAKMSLRELFDSLKIIGAKIEEADDKTASHIIGMGKASNEKIIEFINSFDTPLKSLNKLSYLRKSFKKNELTLLGYLSILSSEYANDILNISAEELLRLEDTVMKKVGDTSSIQDEISYLKP